MTSKIRKMTCGALVASMLALPFHTASAGMIGAEQAAAQTAQLDRSAVLGALGRAETVAQLQQYGVDPQAARERVAAMTDQEVHALAQDMQTAPAGALSTWGWVAVIAVAAAIWYFAFRR